MNKESYNGKCGLDGVLLGVGCLKDRDPEIAFRVLADV